MGDAEAENYDDLMRNLTNANTMLLNDASDNLEFNSIDALDQVKHPKSKKLHHEFRGLVHSTQSQVSW